MSLSSPLLTELSSEPNGSFSVPVVGSAPAQPESAINILQPPAADCKDLYDKKEGGRINTSTTGEIRAENGQGRGRTAEDIKKRGIWKPPDWGKSTFRCQKGEKKNREVQRNRRATGDYPEVDTSNRKRRDGSLEPSADEAEAEKQNMSNTSQQGNNECIDKMQNHIQQGEIKGSLPKEGFKEGEKGRRRAPAFERNPKPRTLYSSKHPLFYPANNKNRKDRERTPPLTMDINNNRAPSRAREESRLTQSSIRSRADRPILTSTGGRGISMLLGKMLTENRVALAKAAGAARYAWGGYGEVNVQPTETQNLFIFTFSNEEIREKIWRVRPWSLSNTLTAVEKYNGRGKPEEVPMEKVAMWVQIHGMHQNQRSEQNMVVIGTHYFPGFLDLDRASLEFSGYRKFLRILVEVDLREPVPIGFDFPFTDEITGEEHCDIIDFKYERLVELCYFCGRIGHNWPTCWRMNEERKRNGIAYLSEVYNSSLKAGIDSPHRNQAASFRSSREGGKLPRLISGKGENELGKSGALEGRRGSDGGKGEGELGKPGKMEGRRWRGEVGNGGRELGREHTNPSRFHSKKGGAGIPWRGRTRDAGQRKRKIPKGDGSNKPELGDGQGSGGDGERAVFGRGTAQPGIWAANSGDCPFSWANPTSPFGPSRNTSSKSESSRPFFEC
ncbi:unnamed protein product [Linum trigynum]|uniref:Zinc knuckle CX2CX4HX4C domain-containing protein n=1 Tax=Linum trigynum TaxID=586398 RepID=A0AAV2CTF0_9ROSI